MKIAIICYNHFDATISLSKYLALLDPGIEVELYFLLSQTYPNIEIIHLGGKNAGIGYIGPERLSQLIDKEIFAYMEGRVKLNAFMFSSNNLSGLKNYKQLFELKKLITAGKFDMLHFVGNNHWVVMLNFLFRNKPHIHTLHEPYPFETPTPYRLRRHKLKIKLLIRSNTAITVPSKVSFERFKEQFKLPEGFLEMIPFGPFEIYKMYLKKQVDKQKDTLLYYGYLSKYKGVEVLIEAVKKVTGNDPQFKLIIAGSGPFDHDLSSLKVKVELINKYLSNEEIARYNQLATVVVCPYTSASQSGVVMTSFAFDNPVIATNTGALPEAVETGVTGLIVPPNDAGALYKAICDLFSNPAEIDSMRNNVNAKYSDSESSWKSITQQTYHLYQIQLKGRKGA